MKIKVYKLLKLIECMSEDKEGIMRDKLNFFMKGKILVHLLLFNKRFYNGIILKKINPNIYLMKDRIIGNVHIFIKDIIDIRNFYEEEKK